MRLTLDVVAAIVVAAIALIGSRIPKAHWTRRPVLGPRRLFAAALIAVLVLAAARYA